jgi:hypothetical protein
MNHESSIFDFLFISLVSLVSLVSLLSLVSHIGRIIPGLYVVVFNGEPIIPFSEDGCLGIGREEVKATLFPASSTAVLLKIFGNKLREEGILF